MKGKTSRDSWLMIKTSKYHSPWPSELIVAVTSNCWSACKMDWPDWYPVKTLGIVTYTLVIPNSLTSSEISVALFIIDNISPSHLKGFWFMITAPIAPARWIYQLLFSKTTTFRTFTTNVQFSIDVSRIANPINPVRLVVIGLQAWNGSTFTSVPTYALHQLILEFLQVSP